MKKIIVSIIIIGLILNLSPVGVANIQNNKTHNEYIPHDPIYINGDDDFTSENGVVGGSGSIDDPYMISGWEVEEIWVHGITKYFCITDCRILKFISLKNIEDDRCKVINCEFALSTEHTQMFCVNSDNVTVENCEFYVYNDGISTSSRIVVRYCNFYSQALYWTYSIFDNRGHSLIENCQFFDSCVGIRSEDYTVIRNCIFQNSDDEGIVIRGNYNLIENCTFLDEAMGIEISTEQHNSTIKNCSFINNGAAIASYVINEDEKYSRDHIIENCEFKNGGTGIGMWQSEKITIRNCVFKGCMESIKLKDHSTRAQITRYCKIYNNYFLNNDVAIRVQALQSSQKVADNVIFNNYFSGNIKNVEEVELGDINLQQWNIEKTPGVNIVGGPYLGGNYWDDYKGKDNDGDGIGDTPYDILDGKAYDYLPLFNPPPEIPIITGPTSGNAGKEYNYTFVSIDPDGEDIASYTIDWGDDNTEVVEGLFASGEEIVVNHTWSEKGTYTIRAKAADVHGIESDWGTLTVTMPKNQDQSQQQQRVPQQMIRLLGSPSNS